MDNVRLINLAEKSDIELENAKLTLKAPSDSMDKRSPSNGMRSRLYSSLWIKDPKTPRSFNRCSHNKLRRGTNKMWKSLAGPCLSSLQKEHLLAHKLLRVTDYFAYFFPRAWPAAWPQQALNKSWSDKCTNIDFQTQIATVALCFFFFLTMTGKQH